MISRDSNPRQRTRSGRDNVIGNFLGHHISSCQPYSIQNQGTLTNSRLRMAGNQDRECTDINNSQSLNTKYAGSTINNGHGIALNSHFACARSVVNGHDRVFDCLEDFCVRLVSTPRVVFISDDDWRHCLAVESIADSLVCCNAHLLVGFRGKPIGTDNGQMAGIV